MPEQYTGARALLYARVSTDDKDQDPETQIRQMRAWCEEHDVFIVDEFREMESAGNTKRTQWRALMGTIFEGEEDITMVVARDETRISRDMDDMNTIVKRLGEKGVMVRYVNSMSTPETGVGQVINTLKTWTGQEERAKLKANTKSGMYTRKLNGIYCSRPVRFAFAEDVEHFPKGRIALNPEDVKNGQVTKIYSEDVIYNFARSGKSMSWVAKNILGMSPSAFIAELKKREDNPEIRKNKDGEPVPFYRNKGLKDRYTPYMELYNRAIAVRKGDCSERVAKTPEICSERGEE